MKKILFQHTSGTIGDLFIVSHIMYNNFKRGFQVYAAIPKTLSGHVREILDAHNFIADIIETENISNIDKLASELQMHACYFLQTATFSRHIKFYPVQNWINLKDTKCTVVGDYIVVHVASSANYNRPVIPNFENYIEQIEQIRNKPVFIGTFQDEELFKKSYPDIYSKYNNQDECWRFGKDSLKETMANILQSNGVFTFSSWSSIFSALAKKPTFELWNSDQWPLYNQQVKYLLGSPVNLIQGPYNVNAAMPIFRQPFSYVKTLSEFFYMPPLHS